MTTTITTRSSSRVVTVNGDWCEIELIPSTPEYPVSLLVKSKHTGKAVAVDLGPLEAKELAEILFRLARE